MSQSVLLNLARKSIEEVLRAERLIDKNRYLEENPILSQNIATYVKIYLDEELRGSGGSVVPKKSLLDDLIYNAKVAAFQSQDYPPLKSSEYLSCVVEVTLLSPLEEITFESLDELETKIVQNRHGVLVDSKNFSNFYLPFMWQYFDNKSNFLSSLVDNNMSIFNNSKVYVFETQSAHDEPILKDDSEDHEQIEK